MYIAFLIELIKLETKWGEWMKCIFLRLTEAIGLKWKEWASHYS